MIRLKEEVYRDIADASKKKVKEGSIEEMSNIIYDTLFNNNDFPQLDRDEIDGYVDAKKGEIGIDYYGHTYIVIITKG